MHFNSFRSRAKWKKKSRFLTDWSKTKSWNRVTEVSITFFIKRGEKRRKLSFSHQAKITTDQREETEKENKLPAFFAKENCYNQQNGFRMCSSSSVSSLPLNFKKYREIAERKLSLGEVGRQNRKWSTPLNSDSCEQSSHLIHSLIHHPSPIPQLRASKPQKNMDGTFQFSTANCRKNPPTRAFLSRLAPFFTHLEFQSSHSKTQFVSGWPNWKFPPLWLAPKLCHCKLWRAQFICRAKGSVMGEKYMHS